MDHNQKYQAKREELQVGLGEQRQQLFNEVAEKETGIIKAKREANERGGVQDREGAFQASSRAAQLTLEVNNAKAKIKEIDLDLERVCTGSYPELAALNIVGRAAMIAANLGELEEAKAAFQGFLTPELKAAAQRFVMASKSYDPLSTAPALAQMIAEGA
jgi:hypothetical protein